MTPQTVHLGKQHILYDAECIEEASANLFEPDWHQRIGALKGAAVGRGTTHFFDLGNYAAVLRHYRRGGLVAKFNSDCYLWTGLESSRPWREWELLAALREKKLPVPKPLAARVVTAGVWYRGDLLMEEISRAQPLSQWLMQQSLAESTWQAVGATIRRFHAAGVYHADLNAHNILLDAEDRVSLIDFDRGKLRAVSRVWAQANVSRLQRSLTKLYGLHPGFHYNNIGWNALLYGYENP